MNRINMSASGDVDVEVIKAVLLFVILVLLWPVLQQVVILGDPTMGPVDPNLLVLILISLICFLGLVGLCWWLVRKVLVVYGLPEIGDLVLQFDELVLWEKLRLYLASFALLLLAAVGCLMAIC